MEKSIEEEAREVADMLLKTYADDEPPPSSHLEWIQRQIMRILRAKCEMQRERDQRKV